MTITIELNDEDMRILASVQAKVAQSWSRETVSRDDAIRTALLCLDSEARLHEIVPSKDMQ